MLSKIIYWSLTCSFLGVSFFLKAQPKATPAASRMASFKAKTDTLGKPPVNRVAFQSMGPTVMSGRVCDIEANPNDPTEFYVCYASGGLWYTRNNGQSFTPIFDGGETLTLGDVAVNWKEHIIWLGTGEVNSSRSSYAGTGIYKSSDNGKTWEWLGLPESHHIGKVLLHPTNSQMAWVAVMGHLYSSNKERGVYMTSDGGQTWKCTLYVSEDVGAVDLDINPSNPKELYAATWERKRSAWNFEGAGAGSGIYKSTDGGLSWQQLSNGLPSGKNIGRIGLSVHAADPRIVYAIIDNLNSRPDTTKRDTSIYLINDLKSLDKNSFAHLNEARLDSFLKKNGLSRRYSARQIMDLVASGKIQPNALYDFLNVNTGFESTPIGAEVYRSDDAGLHWQKTNSREIPIFFSYGYYFAKIYVSPTHPQKLFALGFHSVISTDGGKTWKSMDKDNVHADHHALWIDPARDEHIIDGNDGGVNISYDDGEHWFKANTPAVGQYYAITVDNAKPYHVYGGLQDNGTWYIDANAEPEDDAADTKQVGGGDGMQVMIDKRDNATVYYGFQFGNYFRRELDREREAPKRVTPLHQLGEKPYRFNWQSPILLSQHNNDVFYIGGQKLFRSFNQGDSSVAISDDLTRGDRHGNVPYGTLTTLSESPFHFEMLYAGTDDGNIQFTSDGGQHWINTSVDGKAKDVLPKGLWVSRVIASRWQPNRVYASLNGYRYDDFTPYLYTSESNGKGWTRIGADLPMEPVNVVREDPIDPDILYVGTDGGMYVSMDRGQHFIPWLAGLPFAVPVHDIAIQERDNDIILGTHGRSLYKASLDDIQGMKQHPDWFTGTERAARLEARARQKAEADARHEPGEEEEEEEME